MDVIQITGSDAIAQSPEGYLSRMPVSDLISRLIPPPLSCGAGMALPHGVRAILVRGNWTIWVYEAQPRLMHVEWIASGSSIKYGPGVTFSARRIAWPYLILLAPFYWMNGQVHFERRKTEAMFRTAPLSLDDNDMRYPALLNVSQFLPEVANVKPLSWCCTTYIDRNWENLERPEDRMCSAMEGLLKCVTDKFDMSSEHHAAQGEKNSWFTEYQRLKVDERIQTVENWERASRNPLFVLDVPWLRVGMSLRQVADRLFQILEAQQPQTKHSSDLARVIFNHGQRI